MVKLGVCSFRLGALVCMFQIIPLDANQEVFLTESTGSLAGHCSCSLLTCKVLILL